MFLGTEYVVDPVVNDNDEVVTLTNAELGINIEGLVKGLLNSPYGSEKEESLNASNAEDLLNTTYDVNVQESDTVEEESFVRKRKKRGKPQD